jgi:hypothetical protein
MELTKRFYFRGNASALSGLFYRPNAVIVDMPGASSLGVSGGRSQAQISGRAFGDVIRFGSAKTFAEGVFDDVRAATAVSNFEAEPITLNSTTKVSAEIRDLAVGKTPAPLFRATFIKGALVSHSPAGSGEPSIAPGPGTAIQGVDIGGFGLNVVLNVQLFRRLDTRSKVSAAVDDAKVARKFRQHFVADASLTGQVRRQGLVVRNGLIYTTIVEKITWVNNKPFPKSSIDGHVVTIPNFGKIFFGELLIGGAERRLTMVRFEMGSPVGGWADGGGVDSNGSFYP